MLHYYLVCRHAKHLLSVQGISMCKTNCLDFLFNSLKICTPHVIIAEGSQQPSGHERKSIALAEGHVKGGAALFVPQTHSSILSASHAIKADSTTSCVGQCTMYDGLRVR